MGYKSRHYIRGELNKCEIDKYDFVNDMPVQDNFELLDEMYPDSKFIYNVRPIEEWLASINKYYTLSSYSCFGEDFFGVVIAQIIGALIFFWVDRWIFTGKTVPIFWEVKENIVCADCNKKVVRGYRIVKAIDYDRTKDALPEFRCENCSIKKTQALRERGVEV